MGSKKRWIQARIHATIPYPFTSRPNHLATMCMYACMSGVVQEGAKLPWPCRKRRKSHHRVRASGEMPKQFNHPVLRTRTISGGELHKGHDKGCSTSTRSAWHFSSNFALPYAIMANLLHTDLADSGSSSLARCYSRFGREKELIMKGRILTTMLVVPKKFRLPVGSYVSQSVDFEGEA